MSKPVTQMRKPDEKKKEKEFSHKFQASQMRKQDKKKKDYSESDIEILNDEDNARILKAVKAVKQQVVYQSLPYHRLSFKYDDIMEIMIEKAKDIKKK